MCAVVRDDLTIQLRFDPKTEAALESDSSSSKTTESSQTSDSEIDNAEPRDDLKKRIRIQFSTVAENVDESDRGGKQKVAVKSKRRNDKSSFLRDSASYFFLKEDYRKAKNILMIIIDTQNYEYLDLLMMAAECDLYLGGSLYYANIVHDVLVQSKELSSDDILMWAHKLLCCRRFVSAIFLFDAFWLKYVNQFTARNQRNVSVLGWSALVIGYAGYSLARKGGKSVAITKRVVIDTVLAALLYHIDEYEEDWEMVSAKVQCNHGRAMCLYGTGQLQEAISLLETVYVQSRDLLNSDRVFQSYYGVMESLSLMLIQGELESKAIDVIQDLCTGYRIHGNYLYGSHFEDDPEKKVRQLNRMRKRHDNWKTIQAALRANDRDSMRD